MKEPKLLPCPFCGGKAILTSQSAYDYGAHHYTVSCLNTDCQATVKTYEGAMDAGGAKAAVAKWNRRP